MDSRSGAAAFPRAAEAPAHTGVWRFTVAPVDVSVPEARHAVRDLLVRRSAPLSHDALDGALLIVSELVTNAVRHAALLTPRIGVEVTLDARRLRLAVEDGHPYRPKALHADPDGQGTGGRGLLLVQATALGAGGDCGVDATSTGGKVVWAALPLDLAR
ncbi:ATP-binding protein [Streptomyces radicis]|uniref:ATP-binding protein n=1 Tax=Streptomyces radicis TaxID=1750517 RepID=A0A3A9WS15_9ACTN|nr:ATP-binding protein [Streptomyces radicis]RKN10576.1 ATP-binding protein [Streptomyces radicis]RKN24836.1 ATP-binding protein [Streptomyces radicis]